MTLRKLCELVFLLLLVVATANMAGKQTVKGAGAADTVDTFPYATFAEDVPGESERGSEPVADPGLLAAAELAGKAEAASVQSPKLERLHRDVEQQLLQPSWRGSIYKVRIQSGGLERAGGTAVAVGVGKLHTAGHINDGVPGQWEVLVGEQWIPARADKVHGKDLAVLSISGPALNPVPVREPVYGEKVTIFGLTTTSSAQGTYIGVLHVSDGRGAVALDPGEMPTRHGDSGGGVFGDDGCLLGTLRGSEGPTEMITTLQPIVADKSAVAALRGGGSPPPAPANASVPAGTQFVSAPAGVSCSNGVCTQQSSGRWVKTRRGMQWQTF